MPCFQRHEDSDGVMELFGTGRARICAVAAAKTAAEMAGQVRAGLRKTPTIELRLDWLADDRQRAKFLGWLKKQKFRGAALLATCRRVRAGGRFRGDIPAQLHWLVRAREAGCAWCDVEVETLRVLPGKSVRSYPVPERVLLSVHDFERTPKLPRKIFVPEHGDVDALKIATKARTIADSVRLVEVARRSKHFVAVPMGEAGLPARILALREGSALAYAPIGERTAPGQVSLQEMMKLYRAHELTRKSQVFGVIGNPVGHSLSPLMHNTAFVERGVDAVYLPFLVRELKDFLGAVEVFGIRGFSVTIPHKEKMVKFLKDCDALAAEIGAVNTVTVRRDGSLYGCNTDYLGILKALQTKVRLRGSRVLILGAGGAARAAAFATAHAGAQVAVCARRERPGKALARAVGGEFVPRRALRSEKFDAIINTTPVGMHPHEGVSPLSARELNCRVVMDLINRPMRTELLRMAQGKGLETVSGVEMFVAQGVAQWELWTEQKAPEQAMRRVVIEALRAEERRTTHVRGRRG
jgi:3-dehydroquinate dehydratase / shikimate dehydrogenase